MAEIVSYQVKLRSATGLVDGFLGSADATDMPARDSRTWTFDWGSFWNRADFDCEAFIKLTGGQQLLGLARVALYPFPFPDDSPEYVEILQIQCVPKRSRDFTPVGFWLIWYATQIALDYCTGDGQGLLLRLDAVEGAIAYYRDKVMMEPLGWVSLSPSEEGYAFGFTEKSARSFCRRVEQTYGTPILLA